MAGQFSTNCENFEISPKQIEENQRQIQIIDGKRLPSWSLSLITKIILIIFTRANDSPNLAHCLLMAFSDLEKQKRKFLLEKQYAGASANNSANEQKTLESLLKMDKENTG